MTKYESIKGFRARQKERAIYVMGGSCQCCGYSTCIQALEFHHLNPEEKEINFGSNTNLGWGAVKEELKKCILVCANCHREIHYGIIDNSQLVSSYDEAKAEEISQKVIGFVQHKIFYCQYCGAEVYKGNNTCPACANKLRQKVARPCREELKLLIRTQPFTHIAKEYGVTDNAIRKWCMAENLPYKKKEIQSYSDIDWELL